jgi:hypothetical protein
VSAFEVAARECIGTASARRRQMTAKCATGRVKTAIMICRKARARRPVARCGSTEVARRNSILHVFTAAPVRITTVQSSIAAAHTHDGRRHECIHGEARSPATCSDNGCSSARGSSCIPSDWEGRRGGLLAEGHRRRRLPDPLLTDGISGRCRGLATYSCGGSAGLAPDFPVASRADANMRASGISTKSRSEAA